MSSDIISSATESAFITHPLWMQAGSGDPDIDYTAQDDRALINAVYTTEGILDTSHFKVTQRGAGVDRSVDISGGSAVITGDTVSGQGKYLVRSTGTVNLPMPAPPVSGTRTHRVVLGIRDAAVAGGSNYDFYIDYLEDTGSGLPAEPDSAITLATVPMSSGTTTIPNSIISEKRAFARLGTGLAPGTNVCRVNRSLLTQIGAGNTPVPFDNEDWDLLGGHEGVTNPSRYTCKVAGKYNVSGVVRHMRDAASPSIQFFFSGSAYNVPFVSYNTASVAGGTALHFNDTFQMAVGDYVDVRVDNSPNLFTAVNGSYMNIIYVGT